MPRHDEQTREDQLKLELSPNGIKKSDLLARLQQRGNEYWTENQLDRRLRELLERKTIIESNGVVSLAAQPSVYEYAVWLTRVALAELIDGEESVFYGSEILKRIREMYPEEKYGHWSLNERTYVVYLTRMANDGPSRVVRVPSGYGYTLTPLGEGAGGAEGAEARPAEAAGRQVQERSLYRLLANWLASLNYRTRVSADLRAGGLWGNPDVVGVRLLETVWQTFEVEVVTIEVKNSSADWKRWIFEAIAHKRFSDRSYFAFPVINATAAVEQVPEYQEMRKYGEQYGIGIVVVFIDPSGVPDGANQDGHELDDTRVRFVEVLPAPYAPASTDRKDWFLRNVVGVNCISELMDLGRE